jgi:ribosomal protein S18 acetylase RimI-like enzyme
LDGFARHPYQFRIAPEDEQQLSLAAVRGRLAAALVIGGFDASGLAGIAGLTQFEGRKLCHRALLWGMYVHERARGSGLSDALMKALLGEARRCGIEQVLLTVAAGNDRAQRLYYRWQFVVYGAEPRAIKMGGAYCDELLMICSLT